MAFNATYKAPATSITTMQDLQAQQQKSSTLAKAVNQAQGKPAEGETCATCGQVMPNTDDSGDN